MTQNDDLNSLPKESDHKVETGTLQSAPVDSTPNNRSGRRTRMILIFIVVFFAIGNLGYRFLVFAKIEQTAALFIGLPALLAIATILLPNARSVAGSIFRTITVALLMSGPILGEGFLCILISSPLFYAVGLVIGLTEDYRRSRNNVNRNKLRAVVWLPVLVMSLEGVTDTLSFSRNEEITVVKTVMGSVEDCERHLARKPVFTRNLPGFLAAGWPRPAETSGEGLALGSKRTVRFVGSEGHPGTLTMEVSERRPGFVRFTAVDDTSHMPHWLDWDNSAVTLTPVTDGKTQVTWTTTYIRRLDPAWYFAPWQRYAVKLATGYLIDNLADPTAHSG